MGINTDECGGGCIGDFDFVHCPATKKTPFASKKTGIGFDYNLAESVHQ
jgi:hypothetical protein